MMLSIYFAIVFISEPFFKKAVIHNKAKMRELRTDTQGRHQVYKNTFISHHYRR